MVSLDLHSRILRVHLLSSYVPSLSPLRLCNLHDVPDFHSTGRSRERENLERKTEREKQITREKLRKREIGLGRRGESRMVPRRRIRRRRRRGSERGDERS